MFGWINDCTECLVVSRFGSEAWHAVKRRAGMEHVPDGGFLRYKYYDDADTVRLVVAASQELGTSVDGVLFAFGEYFVEYVQTNGYSNVLRCLGNNLRDWLSNLNALHDHLQASYPKGFIAPVFWSEDDTTTTTTTSAKDPNSENAILVHYYSQRGSLLVPLVHGLIQKIALEYFDVVVDMALLQVQDETEDAKHSTWRITTQDPDLSYRLRGAEPPPEVLEKQKRRAKEQQQQQQQQRQQQQQQRQEQEEADADAESSSFSIALQGNTGEVAFLEGERMASDLRTEEFVERHLTRILSSASGPSASGPSPASPTSSTATSLHDGIDERMKPYVVKYFQENLIDGKRCYDIWTMDEDDPTTWASFEELGRGICPMIQQNSRPNRDSPQPQEEQDPISSEPTTTTTTTRTMILQLSIKNLSNGENTTIELPTASSGEEREEMLQLSIQDALTSYCSDAALLDRIMYGFTAEEVAKIERQEGCIECVLLLNTEEPQQQQPYHTFTLDDLATTTCEQLIQMIPPAAIAMRTTKANDESPKTTIDLQFQCTETIPVDDDEEDI